MTPSWVEQRERGSNHLMRAFAWLARHVGHHVAGLLLYPITAYFVLTAPAARRASRQYLRRALGRAPGWRDVFRHFHCFARTILDRVLLLGRGSDGFEVRVDDPDGLMARMERGEGCLLIGAHLGSFEVLRILAVHKRHLKLRILMRAEHSPALMRILAELDPEIAATIMPIGRPGDMLRLRELLEAGYLVGLMGDRALPGEARVPCRFMGDEALLPAAPMQLASALRAPVFLFFGLLTGERRYHIRFEKLGEQVTLDPARREADLRCWLQRYADRLEHHARLAPYNWFNFFPFWPT